MKRLSRLLAAASALAMLALGVPATAAETSGQQKDRAHQEKIQRRMKARAAKPNKSFKDRVDQAADATRVGGSWSARKYHGGVHATKKGVNAAAKKTEKATK